MNNILPISFTSNTHKTIKKEQAHSIGKNTVSDDLKHKSRNMIGAMALSSMIIGGNLSSCVKIEEPIFDEPVTYTKSSSDISRSDFEVSSFLDSFNKLHSYKRVLYATDNLGIWTNENKKDSCLVNYYDYADNGHLEQKQFSIPILNNTTYSYIDSLTNEKTFAKLKRSGNDLCEISKLVLDSTHNTKVKEETNLITSSKDGDGGILITTISNYDHGIKNGTPQDTVYKKIVPNKENDTFIEYVKDGEDWIKTGYLKKNEDNDGYSVFNNDDKLVQNFVDVENDITFPTPITFNASVVDWEENNANI